MLHDKIESAEACNEQALGLELPLFRNESAINGLTHIRRKDGDEGCSCLAGLYRLLVWASRNNGY